VNIIHLQLLTDREPVRDRQMMMTMMIIMILNPHQTFLMQQ